jgi:hypothetical protein
MTIVARAAWALGAISAIAVAALIALAGASAEARAPASCERAEHGTRIGEKLVGTRAGDRIHGMRGRDAIRGRASGDCLNGGRGFDRVDGDQGSDILVGGSGSDKLRAGAGADTIRGGRRGDVLLAADGREDLVLCAGGRDRARVDRFDVVRGCEQVRGHESATDGPGDKDHDPSPDGEPPPQGPPAGTSPPPQAPPAPPGQCPVSAEALADVIANELSGCGSLLTDTASTADPNGIWGSTDCASASRHQHMTGGGDPHATAAGDPQGNDSFRRLTVLDGDDYYGERCELGRNNHTHGPTVLYREGDRRITFFSLRLQENLPIASGDWQVVMQMKQTNPAANGDGSPIIELDAKGGKWRLINAWNELWSTPAEHNQWTRFAFDVRYSQDPSVGSIKIYVDLNGDGDAADAGEQSPTFHVATLKRETDGGSPDDGIAPGESIPGHLRVGPYHDRDISCPAPGGCSVDVDNVQVVPVQ